MARRTPIYIKTDSAGNIIQIARGTNIDLVDSGIQLDKDWQDIRNDKLVHLAQGIASKRFKLDRGKLKVKDTHYIDSKGKLKMRKQSKKNPNA